MTKATLTIRVQSFSFKQGLPTDDSGNGGGFVFDCRGILNPGRFDEYKKQTGRDQAVKDFLESKTKIHTFLEGVKQVIGISIEDYISRNFENLMISFGCTGGQHRSVYCADYIANYIQEKYNVSIVLKHLVQDAKNWVND
ncbi:MAG: RNase adapter RapZ [Chitinophagaceae bacterium]